MLFIIAFSDSTSILYNYGVSNLDEMLMGNQCCGSVIPFFQCKLKKSYLIGSKLGNCKYSTDWRSIISEEGVFFRQFCAICRKIDGQKG